MGPVKAFVSQVDYEGRIYNKFLSVHNKTWMCDCLMLGKGSCFFLNISQMVVKNGVAEPKNHSFVKENHVSQTSIVVVHVNFGV